MARRVQLPNPAAAARHGAIPGRIIGGSEPEPKLPTSLLTTDSDGPPAAAGKPRGRGPPGRYPGPGSHNWPAHAANLATDD